MNQTNKSNDIENKNAAKNRGLFAVLIGIIGILVLAIIIILLAHSCGANSNEGKNTGSFPLIYDSNAVEGGWEEADTEKIIENLNEQVDEGMINISMNTSPVFTDGESEGNLMIVNEGVNRFPQIIEITRNDTGDVIYRSGAIPVGSKIEMAKLDVALPAGVYECTAMFYSIDPDTGASLGCAGAVINITILE